MAGTGWAGEMRGDLPLRRAALLVLVLVLVLGCCGCCLNDLNYQLIFCSWRRASCLPIYPFVLSLVSTGSWVELQGKALSPLRCTWPLGSLSLERGAVRDARTPLPKPASPHRRGLVQQQHRPCPPSPITILDPAVATRQSGVPAGIALAFSNVAGCIAEDEESDSKRSTWLDFLRPFARPGESFLNSSVWWLCFRERQFSHWHDETRQAKPARFDIRFRGSICARRSGTFDRINRL